MPVIKETNKKHIVLFAPEKEHHELPLQFIYYLLRKNKNKVTYFGSNVPLDAIDTFRQNKSFDHMLFHLVTNLTNKHAQDYVKEISKMFPEKKIVMSGMLVRQITHVPSNVRLLKSMDDILRFTEE